MKKLLYACLALLICGAVYLYAAGNTKFGLFSPDFENSQAMPTVLACSKQGDNRSPDLYWKNPPEGTKSFAIIIKDPDAPGGNFIHWVIYNIPQEVHHLAQWVGRDQKMEDGTLQGKNSFNNVGYDGPCPPPGNPHRYFFTIYALDTLLNLQGEINSNSLENAMEGHVLWESSVDGNVSKSKVGKMYENRPLLSRRAFFKRLIRNIIIGLFFAAISLYIGMLGYHHTENLPWIDSYLNAAMILSGMGPVDNPKTFGGKFFAGSYALYSGLAFLIIMAVMFAPVFHRFFHKFLLQDETIKSKQPPKDTQK